MTSPIGLLDGWFHDNVSTQGPSHLSVRGEATNTPAGGWPTDETWIAGMHRLIAAFTDQAPWLGDRAVLMCNIGDCSRAAEFTDCKRQVWEYLHEKGDASGYASVPDIQDAMAVSAAAGAEVFWGTPNRIPATPDPWWTTAAHADLDVLLAHARGLAFSHPFTILMHASGNADTADCYLYHGPTCEPIT